jgi:hypothetical protein
MDYVASGDSHAKADELVRAGLSDLAPLRQRATYTDLNGSRVSRSAKPDMSRSEDVILGLN